MKALERQLTPEEADYRRYLSEIEARRQQIAELRLQLEIELASVDAFARQYHARFASLFAEQDLLKAQTRIMSRRLDLVRLGTFDEQLVESILRREFGEGYASEFTSSQTVGSEVEERVFREPDSDLREIYLRLVKRVHPDLAGSGDEAKQRHELMAKVNQAFRDGDKELLIELDARSEYAGELTQGTPMGEKLIWAIRELHRLDSLIVQLCHERSAIEGTEMARLMQNVVEDPDALDRLEARLRADIKDAVQTLRRLESEHSRLRMDSRGG